MAEPIYKSGQLKAAFHLRYTWTGWPKQGSRFGNEPSEAFFQELDVAWKSDQLNRLSYSWTSDQIQICFSTTPAVSPRLFTGRIKGRLQHALRKTKTPTEFSRKVSFRAIGDNHSHEVASYIANQVKADSFVDVRFSEMLQKFTSVDSAVSLQEPTETVSGRYWYNLHLVLVVSCRDRIHREADFQVLDGAVLGTARKHSYEIAARSWMPDHFHVALRGNIEQSPETIALALMNNTAFAMGQVAIWQPSFYVGSFSEYDVNAIRKRDGS